MKTHMKVMIFEIGGYSSSMRGLALMRRQPLENMQDVAEKLAHLDHGHNKFLEHMIVWVSVQAPRYWWQEADTYRHTSKQSESSMYDVMKQYKMGNYFDFIKLFEDEDLTEEQYKHIMFALDIEDREEMIYTVKRRIPEGLLQTREWCLSMKTFREMVIQRYNHRLPHWRIFLGLVYKVIPPNYKDLLGLDDSMIQAISNY